MRTCSIDLGWMTGSGMEKRFWKGVRVERGRDEAIEGIVI
jgi:hypothetical protein